MENRIQTPVSKTEWRVRIGISGGLPLAGKRPARRKPTGSGWTTTATSATAMATCFLSRPRVIHGVAPSAAKTATNGAVARTPIWPALRPQMKTWM